MLCAVLLLGKSLIRSEWGMSKQTLPILASVLVLSLSGCGRSQMWTADYCGDGVLDPDEECDDGNRLSGDGCNAACQVEILPECGDGRVNSDEECDDGERNSDTVADACRTNCRLPFCGDGVVDSSESCDDGNRDAGDGCDERCLIEPDCGNGVVEIGEECDDGNTSSGDGCDSDCRFEIPEGCGDGRVDSFEACDDGNRVSGDGCSSDCLSTEICGNGYRDWVIGEECDDGNTRSGDGCDWNCQLETPLECGDGRVEGFEVCDDGNRRSGDGCSADCLSDETCGNAYLDWFVGEGCDDGNRISGDGCDRNCQVEVVGCGNGRIDPGEVCDDGNRASGDGCSSDCQSNEVCGNGYVDRAIGEECDDGNTRSGDGCDARCQLEVPPNCGDGRLDPGEVCDDGNRRFGDGCSGDCLSDERCGNGYLDWAIDEECDDGNTRSGDGCDEDCLLEMIECGNGRVDAGEICDDGNLRSGDGCSSDCLSDESCGNAYLDRAVGEECDDGNRRPGDGCDEDCRLEVEGCGNGRLDFGEVCDDGNTRSGDGCSADCRSDESCGNSYLDVAVGEECDDGNRVDGDGCSSGCRIEIPGCGDGELDPGEVCDDGNNIGGDGCSADCLSDESCGNGYLDTLAGEVCDDGNTVSGDGCSANCLSDESCGNGTLDAPAGEECDDGNRVGGDGCDEDCRLEECDVDVELGTLPLGVTVSRTVEVATADDSEPPTSCGDGREVVVGFGVAVEADLELEMVQAGDHQFGIYNEAGMSCTESLQTCYDPAGAPSGGQIISSLPPGRYYLIIEANAIGAEGTAWVWLTLLGETEGCGDGVVDAGEVCDDGNTVSGDGCSGDCLSNEECGNGYLDIVIGEECDDGNRVSGDGCSSDCLSDESCGNGILDVEAGEVCDDGNRRGGDGCSADCLSDEICGNGIIDGPAGEECDDGGTMPGDGCDADCQVEAGICYIDEDLGALVPGVPVERLLDVVGSGDEWVTGCTSSGPDVVLRFELERPGDIDLVFSQDGDHAMGLYTEREVTDVCTASGGVCLDRGPGESGEVIFMGRPAGVYYLTAEGQGPSWAGTVDIYMWVHGCAPDEDLGIVSLGGAAATTADTTLGSEMFDAGCASEPSGRERVIAFQLDGTSDITVSWDQTGDHVIALLREDGGECDEHQIACHDPTAAPVGSVDFPRLSAGSYLLMVDAHDPGDEGRVDITIENF